ncbi:MAG: hypothetical protein K6T27_05505 [Thermoleophilum sp.]|nr:hypothetical protein [Thermoleophilum sp.]
MSQPAERPCGSRHGEQVSELPPHSSRADGAPTAAVELARRLAGKDTTAAPAALNIIEDRSPRGRAAAAALLAELARRRAAAGETPIAEGIAVGVTGPPGAGKSTLLSALVAEWRKRGRTVALLAVDPSSRRSGGALLGDRARIQHDPNDRGVFIRSTAAAGRLGGLAPSTFDAVTAMRACFDVVVVETVGVGQSETDVEDVADVVVLVVQPGSGDVLQFLKAGIMEVPDILVVTKADLGAPARRARLDLEQALAALGVRDTPVLEVASLPPPRGIDALVAAVERRAASPDIDERRREGRWRAALREFRSEYGERALRALGGERAALAILAEQPETATVAELVDTLALRCRS